MSSSRQNPGLHGWGKEIQFAFKWHLQAVSFILTTRVIEVENVEVQTLRNFTRAPPRRGGAFLRLGWDSVRVWGPRAAPVFMWLLSL